MAITKYFLFMVFNDVSFGFFFVVRDGILEIEFPYLVVSVNIIR